LESRTDATINFTSASGWPATLVPAAGVENFSVRWSGHFLAPATATYTFRTISDDGVRLVINGSPVINNWTTHGATTNTGAVALTAGQLYPIVLEYFQSAGGSVISLEYEALAAGIARQIVPATQVMNVFAAREQHTATLLADGRVLAVGGFNSAPLDSAQLYNPATGLWNATASLNTPRYRHTATLLPNGQVLVVGGLGATGTLASAEIYDTRFADIVVEQPLDTVIPDGGANDFGPTTPGTPLSLNFYIRNPASSPVAGFTVTIDGPNAADFTVTRNPPSRLLGLERGGFTVRFAPATPGLKTATLHIANSSTPALGKSVYDVTITGRLLSNTADTDGDSITDAQEWLLRGLGFDWLVSQPALAPTVNASVNGIGLYSQTQYNAHGAANLANGITTGQNNVINSPNTYGLYTLAQYNLNRTNGRNDVINFPATYGLYTLAQYTTNRTLGQNDVLNAPNAYGLYSTEQVETLNVNMPLLRRNPATGLFKLTVEVQKATNITQPFLPFPMNGPGASTMINTQGILEFQFPGSDNVAFYRLQSGMGGIGSGWSAQYYKDATNTSHLVGTPFATRTDATINFSDAAGWPNTLVPGLGATNFSVRWGGQILVPATGNYTFHTGSDDGVRLYLNGQKLIDNWTNHAATTNSVTATLNAGQFYPIVLEYYQGGGQAVISLEYEAAAAGVARQIVPANRVF
jgi:hypothetical protein